MSAGTLGILILASCGSGEEPSALPIVVTTSLLESAVRDAAGPGTPLRIVRLLPPGSCPGHFDLNPAALPDLRVAAVVVRHDYQDVLDEKIRRLGAVGATPVSIHTPGSLLIPRNYFEVVRQVAAALRGKRPGLTGEPAPAVTSRLEELAREIRSRPRPWEGRPALASGRQKDFAEWLGLHVTGVLDRPDDVTPSGLERLMKCPAEVVVANLQEGTQAALSIAQRRRLPAAVFSNFPGAEGYGTTYDDLLRENFRKLEEAWAKR